MRGFYEKKKDIKEQLMFKYITIVVLFSIVCLCIGVTMAKRMVVSNSAILNKVNRIEDSKTKPEYRELAQITQKMTAGESGTGHYTLNGKRKFIGYAPVQGKGWAVGVTVEIQDMLSGLNQIVIYMSVFTVLVLICMMYVTRNIANNFSNRLSEVQNELNQIAKGDFTLNKKKYSIIDEIAELDCTLQQTKASLNEMIEKIQATHEKKERKT